MERVFWISKNGEKVEVDRMTYNHLRNVLKLIIKNNPILRISKTHTINLDEANNQFLHDDELLSLEDSFGA